MVKIDPVRAREALALIERLAIRELEEAAERMIRERAEASGGSRSRIRDE